MNKEIVNGRGQTTPDPGKRCYTVPELQEILKCGKVTVYDLLKKNEFRYIKLGGSGYRISKVSFDAWLDKMEQEQTK